MRIRSRLTAWTWAPSLLWILAIAAIPAWNAVDPGNGWDAKAVLNALHSTVAGRDPYLDGMAAQDSYRALQPQGTPPYLYVYSPITLPLLRVIGALPPVVFIAGYWVLYVAGALMPIWVCLRAAEAGERRVFALLAPAAVFFPGLLQHDAVMGGNIAYILYGVIFGTALLGWRRGQWGWFYVATLAVSCFKIPMLTLLAIPLLSARGQWRAACITAAAGLSLFLSQLWLWPGLFHNYLQALSIVFNRDHILGFGPMGLLGSALWDTGDFSSSLFALFYHLYAIPLFAYLLYLSRQFLAGKFSLERWIPVLLTGVILLNPRVQEYDVAPLAVVMGLIVWRAVSPFMQASQAVFSCVVFFAASNAVAIYINTLDIANSYWNHMEGLLLITVFTVGCWGLQQRASVASYRREVIGEKGLGLETSV